MTSETCALGEGGHLLVTASMSEGRVPGSPVRPRLSWSELGNMVLVSVGFLNLSCCQALDSDSQSQAVNTKIGGQCLLASPAFLNA